MTKPRNDRPNPYNLRKARLANPGLLKANKLLRTKLSEIETRLARQESGASRNADTSLPYLAHLGGKVRNVEASLVSLQESVQAIYESRIWKSLRQLAGVVLWAATLGREKLPLAHAPRTSSPTPLPGPTASPENASTSASPERILLFWEQPDEGSRLPSSGMIRVRGWCLADSGIENVEVMIGASGLVPATTGLARPDVGQSQGSLQGAEDSGFELWWPCESLPPGGHEIVVTAVTRNGGRYSLSRGVEILSGAALIDSVFRFHCDHPEPGMLTPVRGAVEVRGWAWSADGVSRVEIRSEGKLIGEAETGVLRADVAADHPELLNSGSSGFLYSWDVSALPAGRQTLEVAAVSGKGDRATAICEVLVDPLWTHVYQHWIHMHEPDEAARKALAAEVAALPTQPTISILVPVYKTPLPLLRRCVESVQAQAYGNWELCLADDGSDVPELAEYLKDCAAADSRIRVAAYAENGGISRATNVALGLASGSFIAFLDSDDELAATALCKVVKAINLRPDIDLFYSDEDKIDENGQRYEPFFKPDWSPDLFLSCNYVCHFVVCRTDLARQAGGLDESYRDGTQDYDFLLRVSERTQKIHRIPGILYHWRAIPGSTALGGDEKPKSTAAGMRALTEHLARTEQNATVERTGAGRYRVQYAVDKTQKVTVVMPTGGNLSLLDPVMQDLFTKTAYPNLELLLVDNSASNEVEKAFQRWRDRGAAIRRIDRRGQPFNYSRLNNDAVRECESPLILFLNDDMNVIEPDWLTAMVEHAQREEIGAVGSLLLYPSGLIQHAGVVLGVFENSAHLFRMLPPKPGIHFDLPVLPRNCSSVTAACLLTRRDVFWEAGGFNEQDLAVAFQDVDFCLKVRALGYRIVYTPFSRLFHHESVTKAEKIPNPAEVRYMKDTWRSVIESDPYYNPNLSRKDEQYSLRFDD